ncbi:MAG TPA: TrkA family potassium uptake protein [Candidatus Limnocylindria bacterium]
MKVIVVGCGRVGATLIELLVKGDHDVTVIDLDRGALTKLSQPFKGTTIQGNGTDLDVLRQAGIDKADAFLALTQGDNRNLMAAQVAKQIFGVKMVIAKVNDPIRANTYRRHGIGTFSRTSILAVLLEAMLMGDPEVGKLLLERAKSLESSLAEAI